MSPGDICFVISKLEVALKTLNKASENANVEQLIYVTNSPNSFSDVTTMYKFSSPLNMVPFSELPTSCQRAIGDICSTNGYSVDTSMLMVCVMQLKNKWNRFGNLLMNISKLKIGVLFPVPFFNINL